MWTRNLCLICIYILRNNAFQISNEASFLAFLQPAATRLKFFLSSSSRLSKTSSASSFSMYYSCKIMRDRVFGYYGCCGVSGLMNSF